MKEILSFALALNILCTADCQLHDEAQSQCHTSRESLGMNEINLLNLAKGEVALFFDL